MFYVYMLSSPGLRSAIQKTFIKATHSTLSHCRQLPLSSIVKLLAGVDLACTLSLGVYVMAVKVQFKSKQSQQSLRMNPRLQRTTCYHGTLSCIKGIRAGPF